MTESEKASGAQPPFTIANRGPLEGLIVLDFTTHKSGPFATYFLAALGATVIKIEEPKGDTVRGYAPFVAPDGSLTMWRERPDALSLPMLNRARGKHSITLNLKSPQGLQIYRELASRADIVVENFASGTADRLGIGYEATRAINPRIVFCSISGFGAGAMTGRKALDVVIQALSGIMLASGKEGDPPMRVGMAIADCIAPLYAIMGINAALYRRERTGQGEYVDISMLGSLTGLLACEEWQALQQVGAPTRTGNSVQRATPFGIYACKDGHIAIAAGATDPFAHALFRIIGRPEWAKDPNFATLAARCQRDTEVTSAVNAWCGDKTVDEVEAILMAADLPVAKVRPPAEAVDDPVVNERREVTNSLHPTLGALPGLKTVGLPIRFHSSVHGVGAAAPQLGQHNDLIFRQWLQLDEKQLASWKAAGAF